MVVGVFCFFFVCLFCPSVLVLTFKLPIWILIMIITDRYKINSPIYKHYYTCQSSYISDNGVFLLSEAPLGLSIGHFIHTMTQIRIQQHTI